MKLVVFLMAPIAVCTMRTADSIAVLMRLVMPCICDARVVCMDVNVLMKLLFSVVSVPFIVVSIFIMTSDKLFWRFVKDVFRAIAVSSADFFMRAKAVMALVAPVSTGLAMERSILVKAVLIPLTTSPAACEALVSAFFAAKSSSLPHPNSFPSHPDTLSHMPFAAL